MKSRKKTLKDKELLLVRPSVGNMHRFVAEEDSCFFDICLPNYSEDSLRKITYFKDTNEGKDCAYDHTTMLEYDTTPPVMPVGFEVKELSYRGDMNEG